MEASIRWLQSAADLYDEIEQDLITDALFNEPAPEPWVAFLIGGILSAVAIVLWWYRIRKVQEEVMKDMKGAIKKRRETGESVSDFTITRSLWIRLAISAAVDSDSAFYTIIKMGAQSFLFLGGLQLNYHVTFSVMLGFFALESCGDMVGLLVGVIGAQKYEDVVVTTKGMKTTVGNTEKDSELYPTNVYEDLTRDPVTVGLVFVTQCILVIFVIADIFENETTNCKDGTEDCPVVGTLGSWSFYVIGILMASVYLLGPKTNFGESEQNPTYWLKLLVLSKETEEELEYKWKDPHRDETKTGTLRHNDIRLWLRFGTSFLINGVGFHALVHALPIQVAAQSSFLGVVIRAVGMMYVVDLDDTPTFKHKIELKIVRANNKNAKSEKRAEEEEDQEGYPTTDNQDFVSAREGDYSLVDEDLSAEMEKILKRYSTKLHQEREKLVQEACAELDQFAKLSSDHDQPATGKSLMRRKLQSW